MPEPTKDVHGDSESGERVAMGEKPLTPLYESPFHMSMAVWVFWPVFALLCVSMAVGFQVGLRRYLTNVGLMGGSPERSVVWFFWGFTVLFILVAACMPLGLYLARRQRYVIHSDGVRLVVGKRTSLDLAFRNIQNVRVVRWWQAFATLSSGFSGSSATCLLIQLKDKAPLSFMFGGGTRQMWIEPENPQAFLAELNGAWNRWRRAHGEAPTVLEPQSSSPDPPPPSANSRAA